MRHYSYKIGVEILEKEDYRRERSLPWNLETSLVRVLAQATMDCLWSFPRDGKSLLKVEDLISKTTRIVKIQVMREILTPRNSSNLYFHCNSKKRNLIKFSNNVNWCISPFSQFSSSLRIHRLYIWPKILNRTKRKERWSSSTKTRNVHLSFINTSFF